MEADGTQIYLIVTATPESGNFDPISLRLTVTITDDSSDGDNPPDPTPARMANMVPGLEDDETGSPEDDTSDDPDTGTGDDDDDGGTPAPMDAMAMFASAVDGGLF